MAGLAYNFDKKKENPAQIFSVEFCEIFKKTFFTEGNQEAASTYTKINYMNEIWSEQTCSNERYTNPDSNIYMFKFIQKYYPENFAF